MRHIGVAVHDPLFEVEMVLDLGGEVRQAMDEGPRSAVLTRHGRFERDAQTRRSGAHGDVLDGSDDAVGEQQLLLIHVAKQAIAEALERLAEVVAITAEEMELATTPAELFEATELDAKRDVVPLDDVLDPASAHLAASHDALPLRRTRAAGTAPRAARLSNSPSFEETTGSSGLVWLASVIGTLVRVELAVVHSPCRPRARSRRHRRRA